MNSINVKFDSEKRVLKIDDGSKTIHFILLFIAMVNVFSNGIQIVDKWGNFDSVLFYIFIFLFITMLGFMIFFIFFNSKSIEIHFNDIVFYREIPFLWTRVKYFKLRNRKLRLINFRNQSEDYVVLQNGLKAYHITIKS